MYLDICLGKHFILFIVKIYLAPYTSFSVELAENDLRMLRFIAVSYPLVIKFCIHGGSREEMFALKTY